MNPLDRLLPRLRLGPRHRGLHFFTPLPFACTLHLVRVDPLGPIILMGAARKKGEMWGLGLWRRHIFLGVLTIVGFWRFETIPSGFDVWRPPRLYVWWRRRQ